MPDGSGKKLNNKETKKQSIENLVAWFFVVRKKLFCRRALWRNLGGA
jgi:hypothetical protein